MVCQVCGRAIPQDMERRATTVSGSVVCDGCRRES